MLEQVKIQLNKSLLIQQGVTKEQERTLYTLHEKLETVLSNPQMFVDPVLMIEEIELDLQENWNFNLDKNKHSYWYRLKGCSCPKMDNKEYWGTRYRIFDKDCQWHGFDVV